MPADYIALVAPAVSVEAVGLPTVADLTAAMKAPGLLRDQPAIQQLFAAKAPRQPRLTLIEGGRGER